ncbi:MAG: hypothetical protein ACOZNI_08350 [Myxococcota bacterium]
MVSRSRSRLPLLFKVVAFALIAMNVTWHGLVALFVGGPLGLGLFLLAVVSVWVWSWLTLRRWHRDDRSGSKHPGDA